ncbi:hypothetical protein EYD45_13530 [Hyunsoonleella flava]|uniref:Uncharacterized protein n=1 Tax=Hyunsoonleella flava TaxID=2527939 RepID=A0A4Q9FC48_9FLAO|nr:hypothetical protein [Hyunsoonleella flava]TBN00842.1 hypothetical protein EYD45_13530 [Hyunsoonleella flava]
MKKSGQLNIFLHVVILLSFIFGISAQENNRLQDIINNLSFYTNNSPPEKVYVQTDKDTYTSGETIFG